MKIISDILFFRMRENIKNKGENEMKKYRIIRNGKVWGQFKSETEARFWTLTLKKSDKIATIRIEKI